MNKKTQHNGIYFFSSFLLMFLMLATSIDSAYGQDNDTQKKNKSRIKIEYVKKGDNSKLLKAKLSSKIDRKPVSVANATLIFYDQTDSTVLVGTTTTNEKGMAEITLSSDYVIGHDTSNSVFRVKFEGNDKFKASSKQFEVKDAGMDVSYEDIDSVHTITVSAYELENGKPGEPLTDLDVYVYVKRLYSLLKVGEGWLQDGEAVIEIPNDLPGDRMNMLQFVTMIPETENYGSLENKADVKWGKPLTAHKKYANEKRRALWEPMAPLWMVISLSVLIIGVFYHYFLIIYKLFKIKKLNKNGSIDTKA